MNQSTGVIENKYNIPGLEKMFIRDEEKMLSTIKQLFSKLIATGEKNLSKDDLSNYTVAVHGIKSALANIGEIDISNKALELEKASYENNFDFIKENTPQLIESLEELEKKIKLSIKDENDKEIKDDNTCSKDDLKLFKEKLLTIKTACEGFEINEAKSALKVLTEKKWPGKLHSVLEEINIHLLHSALKKAAALAEEAANTEL